MNDHSDNEDPNGDGEGVWSPDIEQCFREALLLFPPCGRRKHILQEEGGGKMYGRNELIARHIRMRTGKIRSRKQVSSHIQVLARRKAKQESGSSGENGTVGSASPSSSIGVSQGMSHGDSMNGPQRINTAYYDQWNDRPVVTNKIRLVEFSAFIEYRRQLSAAGLVTDPSKQPSMIGLTNLATNANSIDLQSPSGQQPLVTSGAAQHQGLLVPAYNTAAHLSQDMHFNHQTPQTTAIVSIANTNPYQMSQGATMASSNNSGSHQLQQPLNNNQHHHQLMNQRNTDASNYTHANGVNSIITNYQQQPTPTSSGFTRHSYVRIDYREPICRRNEKIERIDISQIQDKFPEIGGSEGLYQRGPADAFYLVKFWADLNNDFEYNLEDQNSYFGFSCHFETVDLFKEITCSTKACSYGLQVVEKVEKIHGAFNSSNGRYSYEIGKSPMCEFMIQFIKKLRQLPRASQMNSVLENFTVLQVITSEATSEILLCLAFVFEIASAEQHNGSQYHVYKLTKD